MSNQSEMEICVVGMECDGCVRSVENALTALKGVHSFDVSLEYARARITFDEAVVSAFAISRAIQHTGFEVRV